MAEIHTLHSLAMPSETMTPDEATIASLTLAQLHTALGAASGLPRAHLEGLECHLMLIRCRRLVEALLGEAGA